MYSNMPHIECTWTDSTEWLGPYPNKPTSSFAGIYQLSFFFFCVVLLFFQQKVLNSTCRPYASFFFSISWWWSLMEEYDQCSSRLFAAVKIQAEFEIELLCKICRLLKRKILKKQVTSSQQQHTLSLIHFPVEIRSQSTNAKIPAFMKGNCIKTVH